MSVDETRTPWSEREVRATVVSYFDMLKLELAGQNYNKAQQNALLRTQLNGRSKAAVEFKHQNISAIVMELGWVPIAGYKPMKNVQRALVDAVEAELHHSEELDRLTRESLAREFTGTTTAAPDVVAAPQLQLDISEWSPRTTGVTRDYLYRADQNARLGAAGELAALEFEERRLTALGKRNLVSRIEQVSVTRGDGLGYDISSFEESGAKRLIEVKTTVYSKETPFFASRNEVSASAYFGAAFHLYRLFRFHTKVGMYQLRGSLADSCHLTPTDFVGVPR